MTTRKRMTNKSIGWRGNTRLYSVRVPQPVAEIIELKVGSEEDLPDRASVLQDAIARWAMDEEGPDDAA